MFMAQEPQMPSRHERLKPRLPSSSSLILIRASSSMGPHLQAWGWQQALCSMYMSG
jgi:hypothetical protein